MSPRAGVAAVLAIVALACAGAPLPARAQSKVGTTIGQFLRIEPSARCAAMGNTGVALFEGVESVYFNVGALGVVSRPSIQFTHSPWFADITYDYAAAALPIRRWGTLFASVTSLSSGEIEVRTVDAPLGTGERYDVSDVAIGLGFGRPVTSRFATGVQVTYARERIWHSSQRFVTFAVGTVYRLTESGVRLGSSLSNVGTRSSYDGSDLAIQYDNTPGVFGDNSALPASQLTDAFPVPLLFRVGMSVPHRIDESHSVLFMLDALHPNDNSETMNLGTEYTWRELLSLRGGYQALFQTDSELGLTFGFGLEGHLRETQYHVDYAWTDHDHLNETHRLTLVLDF